LRQNYLLLSRKFPLFDRFVDKLLREKKPDNRIRCNQEPPPSDAVVIYDWSLKRELGEKIAGQSSHYCDGRGSVALQSRNRNEESKDYRRENQFDYCAGPSI
jgi:hypothetical protein